MKRENTHGSVPASVAPSARPRVTVAEVLEYYASLEAAQPTTAASAATTTEVLDLFRDYLDNYAHLNMEHTDAEVLWRMHETSPDDPPDFCELFEPAYIPKNVEGFLCTFMSGKAFTTTEVLKAAGIVLGGLLRWLDREGRIDPDEAMSAQVKCTLIGRSLPLAVEVSRRLAEVAEQEAEDVTDMIEDGFVVLGVERDGMIELLSETTGRKHIMDVPPDVAAKMSAGWALWATIGRVGPRWRFVDSGYVYPRLP